jgi:Na+/H+ antiporter NhaD/arsenite permease-like protein
MIGVVIFAVTYVLVSAGRVRWLPLDRPSAAVIGAVLCVAAGVLTPAEALHAVDGRTLLLLFGMMGMGAFLAADGFFERVATVLAARAKTASRLLGFIVWGAGLSAAVLTNDAVCVLAAPLVVGLIRRHRLPRAPFLLALATAANTGSVATLVGNPQNMLCATLGGLEYRRYLLAMLPVAVCALGLNHLMLWWPSRRALEQPLDSYGDRAPLFTRSSWLGLTVIAGTAVLYLCGADLAWTATGGTALLLVAQPHRAREIRRHIDWPILLFFGGLFVVVEGFVRSGATRWLFRHFPLWVAGTWAWPRLSGIFLAGSNLVSNVPFILVVGQQMHALPDPRLGWQLLAMTATFAGNLTLIGSAANVIVAERAREVGGVGFWEHLKVGLPLAVVTTALGALWLVAR